MVISNKRRHDQNSQYSGFDGRGGEYMRVCTNRRCVWYGKWVLIRHEFWAHRVVGMHGVDETMLIELSVVADLG